MRHSTAINVGQPVPKLHLDIVELLGFAQQQVVKQLTGDRVDAVVRIILIVWLKCVRVAIGGGGVDRTAPHRDRIRHHGVQQPYRFERLLPSVREGKID